MDRIVKVESPQLFLGNLDRSAIRPLHSAQTVAQNGAVTQRHKTIAESVRYCAEEHEFSASSAVVVISRVNAQAHVLLSAERFSAYRAIHRFIHAASHCIMS
jgi:predicted nucleic acid-binding protein